MKLGVLFSGGKDSTYAAWLASKTGELVCLITLESSNKSSYMFHTPSIDKARFQAEAMGLPLLVSATDGEKEEELEDLREAILGAREKYEIEGIVTGALASEYQASRIKKICSELGLECINPLWHKDVDDYWEELLENKFEIMIIGVAAEGLGREWLGKTINREELERLKKLSDKNKFHLGFEGGEAETFVLDCPLFRKKIKVLSGDVRWSGNSGTYELAEIGFEDK